MIIALVAIAVWLHMAIANYRADRATMPDEHLPLYLHVMVLPYTAMFMWSDEPKATAKAHLLMQPIPKHRPNPLNVAGAETLSQDKQRWLLENNGRVLELERAYCSKFEVRHTEQRLIDAGADIELSKCDNEHCRDCHPSVVPTGVTHISSTAPQDTDGIWIESDTGEAYFVGRPWDCEICLEPIDYGRLCFECENNQKALDTPKQQQVVWNNNSGMNQREFEGAVKRLVSHHDN